jgi:hypothetical protein
MRRREFLASGAATLVVEPSTAVSSERHLLFIAEPGIRNYLSYGGVGVLHTLCYVNVNELLGFEIGDLETGKKLHRVEVQGYRKGPVDRHGCPSHGVGLTPDETELWLSDGHNKAMHVFDNTVMPPRQLTTVPLRDQPGWITFSIDGAYAYPSTGEVFETRTRKKVAALADETGRQVGSEKLLELVFDGKTPSGWAISSAWVAGPRAAARSARRIAAGRRGNLPPGSFAVWRLPPAAGACGPGSIAARPRFSAESFLWSSGPDSSHLFT